MGDQVASQAGAQGGSAAGDRERPGFLDRRRPGGKSFWDWLDLISKLAIPVVIFAATSWFSVRQAQIADLQRQSDILDTYIGNTRDLLLNDKLGMSKPGDEVRQTAREQTLA